MFGISITLYILRMFDLVQISVYIYYKRKKYKQVINTGKI